MIKKDELRPCIVRIGEDIITSRNVIGECKAETIKEAETHKGYFHTWGIEPYTTNGYLVGTVAGQISFLYGLVEYEDGSIHKIEPEHIEFTDRDNKTFDDNIPTSYN